MTVLDRDGRPTGTFNDAAGPLVVTYPTADEPPIIVISDAGGG